MIPTRCMYEARPDGLVLRIYDPETREWRRPARAYSMARDVAITQPIRAPFGDFVLAEAPTLPQVPGTMEELRVRPGEPLPDGSPTWELVHVTPP